MAQWWKHWLRKLAFFGAASNGNVAITFAFAMLPLIAAIGVAIDYTRANAVKTSLQTAIDSTALLMSKEARTDTPDQLQTNATKFLKAAFAVPEASNVVVSASTSGTTLLINGSAAVPTTIMSAFGFQSLTVSASSTVKWGEKRLRVALVLDNSQSMLDADAHGKRKIDALNAATHKLLKQLETASNVPGDVYVSIVPFDNRVNFGASNLNSDWIDWTDWDQDWYDTHGTCNDGSNSLTRSACEANHCSDPQYTRQTRCENNSETWLPPATWIPTTIPPDHTQWSGCILDRGPSNKSLLTTIGTDYDQIVALPTSNNATKALAEKASLEISKPCLTSMLGLTDHWSDLSAKVDAMVPAGSTNQPIGLVWGWQTLVGGGPYVAPALNPSFQYEQAIILLTDGINTRDRWFGSAFQVDPRMYDSQGKGTCENAKAAGIVIYSIQVNTGSDPLSVVMQNCASPGKFTMIKNADELDTLFKQIGDELLNLRVVQ